MHHGLADIQQDSHGNARLQLEHFQEQLFQSQIGAPVDGAKIVAMGEIAVVQEFLAGSGETRGVMAAHQPGVRLLPMDGQPLQLFEHRRVDQRLNHCDSPLPDRRARRARPWKPRWE